MKKTIKRQFKKRAIALLLSIAVPSLIAAASTLDIAKFNIDFSTFVPGFLQGEKTEQIKQTDIADVVLGGYDGINQVIVLNENKTVFQESDLSLEKGTWQVFSNLDHLNRVGEANALIGKESLPTVKRDPKLNTKPSGWKQKRIGDNEWLYNRCHLIGYQLTGENDNPKNLMTGTRSFNTPHMVKYEDQVINYINTTGNHVLYRITPIFEGNNLVATGVQMQAKSIEDGQLEFNVFIYNVQEGYEINYQDGSSKKAN